MIRCDWTGREMAERICALKHLAAVAKQRRGLQADFNPCLACEEAMKLTLKEEDMAKTGKCKKCGNERTLVAHGLCWSCRKKAIESGEITKDQTKIHGGGRPAVSPRKPTVFTPPPPNVIPVNPIEVTNPRTRGLSLTLDFSHVPELVEKLTAQANDAFRTPEMQALWIVVQAMKGA